MTFGDFILWQRGESAKKEHHMKKKPLLVHATLCKCNFHMVLRGKNPEPELMPKLKQNLGLDVAICRKIPFILGKKTHYKLGEYQCHFCHITFPILQENLKKNLKATLNPDRWVQGGFQIFKQWCSIFDLMSYKYIILKMLGCSWRLPWAFQ